MRKALFLCNPECSFNGKAAYGTAYLLCNKLKHKSMSSYGPYYLIDRIDLTFRDFSSEMLFKQTVKFFAFFKF